MRTCLLVVLLFCASLSAQTLRYIAPAGGGGSDSNNGTTSGTPWLTPNHAVTAPTILIAAAGTYSSANFQYYDWGACTSAGDLCWLKCVTFDACKISTTDGTAGIQVGASYWGVQGFEITTGGGNNYASCFMTYASTVSVHHIVFANNIANGCEATGINASNQSTTLSFDYVAMIGNIAYNAAQSNKLCYSGFSIYQPIAIDATPGTHIYVAGNFSWDNVVPDPCGGYNPPYDGEGINFDTLDGSQSGLSAAYNQQVVADNNLVFLNGSWGLGTTGGGNTAAHLYLRQNTLYGNLKDTNQTGSQCGQLTLFGNPNKSNLTEAFGNLAVATIATGGSCGSGNPSYGMYVSNGNGTDILYSNFVYSAAGNNFGSSSSTGFSQGPNNTTGTNPTLAGPSDPGVPSCGSATSVPNCMATVIANFTPAVTGAKPYGYQIPSSTSRYDPLYPQWLCSVTNLPSGLVTPGCVVGQNWK